MTHGRSVTRPTITSASGYEIAYRHLSPDTLPRLNAAVERDFADTKPTPPTQRVQTAPDEWREVVNTADPTYREALTAWQTAVQNEAGVRLLALCETYGLIYEVDTDEVAALRAAHAAMGDPLDAESDGQIFLWRIVFPGADAVQAVIGRLFGRAIEEAIQAQKQSFRGDVAGPVTERRAERAADEPGAISHRAA